MFRQIGMGAVAVLAAGMMAIGCGSDSGSDAIAAASNLRPGAFPGSQVDANNVAADARGFTPEGLFVLGPQSGSGNGNFDPTMFWNNSNGSAIMLYEAQDAFRNNDFKLLASYFNGTTFSAPVQIIGNGNGAVEDPSQQIQGVKVLWLSTAGNATAAVADKNNDALILFTRNDLDLTPSVVASEEDSNRRLWLTTFNVSDANAPASGSVVRGFETFAVVMDTDIQATTLADTNVDTFGFVSDSLHCTHEFTSGTDDVDSGDTTTFVDLFYGKDTRASLAAASSARYRFVALDLAALTLPAAGGVDLTLGASAFAAGEGVNTNQSVLVHNNMMLWEALNTTAATESDDVVTVTVFTQATAGGVSTQLNLGEALTGTNPDNTQMPDANNLYGTDHGVDGYYAFFTADGYSNAAATADRNPDTDLMAAFWNNVATPTREIAEIDNFVGALDLTAGTDTDGVVPLSGAIGGVTGGAVDTRLNRSANYITVLWLQDSAEITDNDNATGTGADPTGTFPGGVNDLLFARVVQTRLLGLTVPSTRTLVNALSATIHQSPGVFSTTREPTGAGVSVVQDSAFDVDFQADLAAGQTNAQGEGCDRGCSFQGNHLRMNFIHEAGNDNTSITTGDEDRLFVTSIVVVLGATDATVPTSVATEVIVETLDTNVGTIDDTGCVDAGDATVTGTPPVATATAGRVIVVFSSNDNSKLDNPVAGSFAERRFYAWESGTIVTLSTNPVTASNDLFQSTGSLEGVTVPVNENTSAAPSYVGTTLHLWWTEDSTRGGENQLATRSYNLTQTAAATPPVLADRFTPSTATDDPVFIDNPINGSLMNNQSNFNSHFEVVRRGSTVGVFFDEAERLWYQQTATSADGYYNTNGQVRPEIVDNESNEWIEHIWEIFSPNECDNMSRTVVYYDKIFAKLTGFRRGSVRVMQ